MIAPAMPLLHAPPHKTKPACPCFKGWRAAQVTGVACGLAAAVIWGGSSVVSRYLITSNFDAVELTFLRYAACFPAALAIYLVWYPRHVNRLDWRKFAVLVLLAGPPFHFLVIAGYAYVPAGLGAVLLAGLLAVFTSGLGLVVRRQAMSVGQVAALGLVLAGLGCLAAQLSEVDRDRQVVGYVGALIFFVAALAWALLNHLVTRWRVEPMGLTIHLALVSPLFVPFYALAPGGTSASASPSAFALQLVYHGLFVALAATFLFFAAVRRLGAEPAAVLLALAPALSVVFGATFLDEPVTAFSAVGVILVLVGFIATLAAARGRE